MTSKPQVIDQVDRRLIQLEMEKLSLRKETRADALKRVEQINDEMEVLKDKQVKHIIYCRLPIAYCEGIHDKKRPPLFIPSTEHRTIKNALSP